MCVYQPTGNFTGKIYHLKAAFKGIFLFLKDCSMAITSAIFWNFTVQSAVYQKQLNQLQ